MSSIQLLRAARGSQKCSLIQYEMPIVRRDRARLHAMADLHDRFCMHALTSSCACSHAWRDNDFLLWANRSFIHTGTPQDNYQDQARLFHIIWLNSRDSIQPANPAMAMAT